MNDVVGSLGAHNYILDGGQVHGRVLGRTGAAGQSARPTPSRIPKASSNSPVNIRTGTSARPRAPSSTVTASATAGNSSRRTSRVQGLANAHTTPPSRTGSTTRPAYTRRDRGS